MLWLAFSSAGQVFDSNQEEDDDDGDDDGGDDNDDDDDHWSHSDGVPTKQIGSPAHILTPFMRRS